MPGRVLLQDMHCNRIYIAYVHLVLHTKFAAAIYDLLHSFRIRDGFRGAVADSTIFRLPAWLHVPSPLLLVHSLRQNAVQVLQIRVYRGLIELDQDSE